MIIKEFRLEHDRAMGYIPRPEPVQPREVPLNVLANQAFPVPFELHETFRAWINHNKLACFDCFEQPNWICPCYKCETYAQESSVVIPHSSVVCHLFSELLQYI